MRYNGAIAALLSHLDALQGLCNCTYLIQLYQNRIARLHVDSFLETLRVGHKEVITH